MDGWIPFRLLRLLEHLAVLKMTKSNKAQVAEITNHIHPEQSEKIEMCDLSTTGRQTLCDFQWLGTRCPGFPDWLI